MRKQVKESAAAESSMGPWELFERRLAAYLSTMFDPRDQRGMAIKPPVVGN